MATYSRQNPFGLSDEAFRLNRRTDPRARVNLGPSTLDYLTRRNEARVSSITSLNDQRTKGIAAALSGYGDAQDLAEGNAILAATSLVPGSPTKLVGLTRAGARAGRMLGRETAEIFPSDTFMDDVFTEVSSGSDRVVKEIDRGVAKVGGALTPPKVSFFGGYDPDYYNQKRLEAKSVAEILEINAEEEQSARAEAEAPSIFPSFTDVVKEVGRDIEDETRSVGRQIDQTFNPKNWRF